MDQHSRVCDLRHAHVRRVAKTWRSPIQKAGEDAADAEYQWLHDIADAMVPEVRRRFLDAIRAIRGTIQEAELRAALETGNIDRVMQALNLDQIIADTLRPALLDPLQSAILEAGKAAPDATIAPLLQGGELSMRFDLVNPSTVHAARNYGFDLIRQVTDDTRAGIRQIVGDAVDYGGHPYEQARQIRELIGLTESQAKAVSNFRDLLESGDLGALDRARRDKRFDGTLRQALGDDATIELSPEQIDSMVTRYAEKTLKERAEGIARTETINASRLGTQASWAQAADQGLLDRVKVRQGWLITPDDRLCPFCAVVPLMNPEGVPLGEKFLTPLGPVDGPTLHPLCRCSIYLLAF